MVDQMMVPKTDRPGQQVRQIAKNHKRLVQERTTENEAVGPLMDEHIKGVIGERPGPPGNGESEWPIRVGRVSQRKRDRALSQHNRGTERRTPDVPAHESA